ncbi:hypothetical protein NDU88_001386 [Pleurodeles waltl]|uniref:Uncharacterized protein n=1 Tax=Pleurodeles waltl TaxID=8319 RepID=A0AAV7RCG0_PLEWA|nr:hypothetical protein NDU88_001386 [Pleurodeles waltl]
MPWSPAREERLSSRSPAPRLSPQSDCLCAEAAEGTFLRLWSCRRAAPFRWVGQTLDQVSALTEPRLLPQPRRSCYRRLLPAGSCLTAICIEAANGHSSASLILPPGCRQAALPGQIGTSEETPIVCATAREKSVPSRDSLVPSTLRDRLRKLRALLFPKVQPGKEVLLGRRSLYSRLRVTTSRYLAWRYEEGSATPGIRASLLD